MRIAFLAPIKPPDHPIASGDRLIARNLLRALEAAGHEPVLASRFIAYGKRSQGLGERKAAALAEAVAAIDRLRPSPPDLVLAYHPYCKAPDWIGPRIAAAFAAPYVTVEAARASEHRPTWRAEAEAGIRAADLHIWLKPTDRDRLLSLLGSDAPLAHLPPFVDVAALDGIHGAAKAGATPRVLVVGQMRRGKKRRNHELAAAALARVCEPFEALVLGDGPERGALEPLYPRGTRFEGAVSHERVMREMRGANMLLWPGYREPIGMVYLEAAAAGIPSVATSDMGVPLVVRDERTGLLSRPDDAEALAANVERLLRAPELAFTLGRNGRSNVMMHHSLDSATMALQSILARFDRS